MNVHNRRTAAGKPWRDLKSISLPASMQHLRLDARGYPIPFIVDDGSEKPDFRVINHEKWKQCVVYRQCAMTGLPLGTDLAFIGGPLSIMNRVFTDPAMLPDAAEYAMQVCPFLAAPKFAYAQSIKAAAGYTLSDMSSTMSDKRPERFGLGITGSYRLVQVNGDTLINAAMFRTVRYWTQGEEIKELSWKR